jgi:uncharacterized membrane protein required for colicin V production
MVGGLTYTELGIIAVALICVIIGLSKGMARQFLAIANLALIIVATIFAVPWLGRLFDGFFPSVAKGINAAAAEYFNLETINIGVYLWYLVGFILVFIACYAVMSLIRKLADRVFNVKVFKKLDKVLGVVFSLAIFYVLLSALLAVALNLDVFVRLMGITSDLTETITAVRLQINGGMFLYQLAGAATL